MGGLRGLRSKAMFGGFGLYCGEVFFGIVSNTSLFFKVSADTRADYETRGMKPFSPNAKQTLFSFYEVPIEILEEADQLARWARMSIAAARSVLGERSRAPVGSRVQRTRSPRRTSARPSARQ